MFKLSSAGIAAIVALAGLAAPAQAALVTYDFWAASGTGTRQDFDCTTSPACTVVTTNFAISGISMTVVVDTSAGMPQFGNPDGGAGSTSLGGGSYYGYPVGVSASFNIAGPTPFSSGPFALGRGSDVYGEASFASFYGYDDLFTSTVDPQTSNRTSTALSRTLSIGMTDPGPIVFIGGEWLPGMSGLALGSMMFNQQFSVYRVGPGGNVLESTLVVYDFTASDVRFGTGPAPVPEPAPLALLGLGLLATAARRRRG